MLGAIIGDIVGSHYEVEEIKALKTREDKKRAYSERIKILDPKTELFTENSSYTDDSVLTIALADAILEHVEYETVLKDFGLAEIALGQDKYGRSRFGSGFVSWLKGEKVGDSYGNGASMRISAIPYYYETMDKVLEETRNATIPSHNNLEAIIGAEAVSSAIYLSRYKRSKKDIKEYIEEVYGYNLNFNLEDLQHNYRFSSRTSNSVPQAIFCFLESNNFEDCLRKSISIGGDVDTIACIACSIAESYYGVPKHLAEKALTYLPPKYQHILEKFYKELEFRDAISRLNICSSKFWDYIQPNTRRVSFPLNSEIYGVFYDNKIGQSIQDIRVLVPELTTEHSYIISVREYARAYELFQLREKHMDFEILDKVKSDRYLERKEREFKELKKIYEP